MARPSCTTWVWSRSARGGRPGRRRRAAIILRATPDATARSAACALVRRRINPLTLAELTDVADIWVETALGSKRSICSKMERLMGGAAAAASPSRANTLAAAAGESRAGEWRVAIAKSPRSKSLPTGLRAIARTFRSSPVALLGPGLGVSPLAARIEPTAMPPCCSSRRGAERGRARH